jgi:hypothetical protein
MPFHLTLSEALPWAVLAAIFLGAAASRITRRVGGRADSDPAWRDRARSRKWALVCVWLSLAILCVVGEIFVVGAGRLADARVAWAAAGAFVLAFAGSRFRKSFGIPVTVLVLALVLALGLLFQSIRAFTGETEIARVSVVRSTGGTMVLELLPTGQPPELLELSGDYFAPVVRVVIFSDTWVFLGAHTWYRFAGIAPFTMRDGMPVSSGPAWRLPQPSGISESLWGLFEANEGRIPGVKAVQTDVIVKRAQAPRAWSIRVQNDGGVEVVPLSG